MKVTLAELIEVMDAHKGAVIVTMVSETEPKMLVKSRSTGEPTASRFPQGVRRMAYGRFMFGNDHQGNVRAERGREGHADPMGYVVQGLWVSKAHPEGAGRHYNRFLVIHVDKPGKFFFRCRPDSDEHGHPIKIRSEWFAGDAQLTDDEFAELQADYLPAQGKSKKQEVEKEIPYRTYECDNVLSVTMGGITYELDHDPQGQPEWFIPGEQMATA